MSKSIQSSDVKQIIFACEAGMGSSLMSVNSLKKKFKKAGVDGITVVHMPARGIPEDAQVVVVHEGLVKVAISKAPNAVVIKFKHFLNDPIFEKLVASFADGVEVASNVE